MLYKLPLIVLIFFIVYTPSTSIAQDNALSVLIFYKTNGFTHGSIPSGIDMINQFGNDLNWNVDASDNSAVFTSENLAQYNVVIWLNTSGDNLLTGAQQNAFENFIQNGNGFVGVHAATDTYRNGSWPWYNDLVGAIVQTGPNHTSNNFNATMTPIAQHPAITHLGDSWNKDEEYYYWELNGGYLFDGNINLLVVEETGTESYDASRPITWYKEYDGGRSFYTALGHNSSDYTNDELFKTMMQEAIIWAAGEEALTIDTIENETSTFTISPNPSSDVIIISQAYLEEQPFYLLQIYDLRGRLVISKEISATNNQISISSLTSATYAVVLTASGTSTKNLLIKI